MIEEEATVIGINNKRLILQSQVKSACGSCQVSGACGTSVLSKIWAKQAPRFNAKNTIDAKIGDCVIIGIEEKNLLKATLLMYLSPIFAMILCALFAHYYLAQNLVYRDLFVSLISLAGLVFSMTISKTFLLSPHQKQRYSPIILRKKTHRVRL